MLGIDEFPRATWRKAQAGDVTLRYIVQGEGPPLILLHGLSGSASWWKHNIPVLAQSHQVHAIDLVQYDPRGSKFTLRETSARLADWFRSLSLGPVALIGHSMGGAIAAELTADFAAQVSRLVLVNPAILFPRERFPVTARRALAASPHFPLTLLPVLVEDALRAGPRLLWKAAFDLVGNDVRLKLPAIQAPTLVIWGVRDPFLSVNTAREIQQLIPRCELEVWDHVGHNPMWEQPDDFNRTVTRFLSQSAEPIKD